MAVEPTGSDGSEPRGIEMASLPASLWWEAVSAAWAHRRHRWWSRFPYLPVPAKAFLRWRIYTAYGRADHPIRREDLVDYLRWRRRFRR